MQQHVKTFKRRWQGMIQRCSNPKAMGYSYYFKRGVSKEWRMYENFALDMFESFMDHAYEHGLHETTLDRIDNSKGYSKENCRWATWAVQYANHSDRHHAHTLKTLAMDLSGPSPVSEDDIKILMQVNS